MRFWGCMRCSPEIAEFGAGLVIAIGTCAAASGSSASRKSATKTINCRLAVERNTKSVPCSWYNQPADFALWYLTAADYSDNDSKVVLQRLGCKAVRCVTTIQENMLRAFRHFSRRFLLSSPGCVDPYDVQVAEIVTLWVQRVRAGTAFGPQSMCWDSFLNLHLHLVHHW